MKHVCGIIIVLLAFTSIAQKTEKQLLQLLETKSGKEKVQIYYDLSMATASVSPQKARDYVDKGITLSHELEYQLGITKGTLYNARLDVGGQNYELGIDRFLQVMYSGEEISKKDSIELLSGMANALSEIGAYELAIDFRKKLLALRKLKTGPDVYYPYDNIAYSYLQLEQYDSANYYYNMASEIAEEMGDQTTRMHCYNNLGYGYFIQGDESGAMETYAHGLRAFESTIIPNSRDSILYGMLLRNSALVQKKINFSLGIDYLSRSTEMFSRIKDTSFLPRNLVLTADLQIDIGQLDEANDNLRRAFVLLVDVKDKLHYYQVLSRYYSAKNQDGLALDALKKYMELEDMLSDKQKVNAKISDVIEFQTNRIKSELDLQRKLRENEGEIGRLKIQLIIGGSGMLFIIMLVLFLKYTSGRKKKLQLMEAESLLTKERLKSKEIEQKRLEEELRYKNRDLTDFAIDSTRKHEFIEEILLKLNALKKSRGIDSEELKNTIQFVKAQLLIDENLKLFQDNIDQINHEFMDKLESQFPELTKNEKQLCALLRLQLSSKEIATVKNISTDSVKTLRYRLRKKLELKPDEDLGEFLKSLG